MLLFIFSLLFKQFSVTYLTNPPKKINSLEGFRSKKSTSSQTNWDKAQLLQGYSFKIISNVFMILGILIFLLEVLSFIFWGPEVVWLLITESLILGATFIVNKYYIDSKLA